jgi:hypothetical protein
MVSWIALAVACAALVVLVATAYVLIVTGRVTIDTGWGRRVRPLGPMSRTIGAPREVVFELIGVPYLAANPPREIREKVRVVERGDGMVLAAHRTRSGPFTTVTLETVTFDPPEEIRFHLVRGPVPHVRERFLLRELEGGEATELVYEGELGTDGWSIGAWWGRVVATRWEQVVGDSMEAVAGAAEGRADPVDPAPDPMDVTRRCLTSTRGKRRPPPACP